MWWLRKYVHQIARAQRSLRIFAGAGVVGFACVLAIVPLACFLGGLGANSRYFS
jgi:hypothetical protein